MVGAFNPGTARHTVPVSFGRAGVERPYMMQARRLIRRA